MNNIENESFLLSSLQVNDNDKHKTLTDSSKEPIPLHHIKDYNSDNKQFFVESSLQTHRGGGVSSDLEYNAIINILCGHFTSSSSEPTEAENHSFDSKYNSKRDSLSFLTDILLEKDDDQTLFPTVCNQIDFLDGPSDCDDEDYGVVTVENDINVDTSLNTALQQQQEEKDSRTTSTLPRYSSNYNDVSCFGHVLESSSSNRKGSRRFSTTTSSPMNKPRKQFEFFGSAMRESYKSQLQIHDWDRKMGLKRSHSKTMRHSMKTRNALRKLLALSSSSSSTTAANDDDIGTPVPYFPPSA